MMTCRLLCALLVLALCCCPSVCAAETAGVKPADSVLSSLQSQEAGLRTDPSNLNTHKESDLDTPGAPNTPVNAVAGVKSDVLSTTQEEDSEPGDPGPDGADADSPVSRDKPNKTVGIVTEHDTEKSKTDKEVELRTQTTTTTTTTKAPSTTTTTTTTEALSTTTTEAPTTTTTRAPSRLREIDGSLSSSAWVFAPLLLAVSALAYTTLC
ncbi:putative mucin TcMUCII [Trypanosoma cruzi]|uniref:Mucin TcMUCII, putative n=2 Tax=Trypanosoma cruzi TaxID=5693 RepID=Q4DU51_TRYCC|nr:mucin TcMUCII, putative [Trypanosoma cruzi]EAN96048.1 mucin TcMUCII, putative [Trypanosoma cruzi]PWV06195.1 putative mucin TcMUCII [Trypanosoma cruzi]RNC52723.1 mucin TcMUCII [Trypanosoma cruzi]|eukprot:XP_817899.1 mucin TcMUCII [Trypanosoma cruzi strain CL Brener]